MDLRAAPKNANWETLRSQRLCVHSETSLCGACNPAPRSSGFPLLPKVCPELAPPTPSTRGSHSHLGAVTPDDTGLPRSGAPLTTRTTT